jgi:RecA-family ATPase
MEALAAWAYRMRVAVVLIHHTSKLNALAEMRHGDPDICRGASAIVDGSRAVFTFLPLDKKEGESLGISDQERRLFSRLELAKTNLGPNNIAPVYFKRRDFMSARGSIPVLAPHSWEAQRDGEAARLAELLWVMMAEKATTRITKTELVARWKETDGIRGQQNDKTVGEAVSRICSTAGGKLSFEHDGKVYTYAREMEGRTTIFVSADLH